MNDRITLGWREIVSFPSFGLSAVDAKIDTGAFSGALHCTQIEEFKAEDGKILRFSPFDHPEIVIETKDYRTKFVRSSNGSRELRYLVKTSIEIKGQVYAINLTLADRTEMTWPVLIGRKFLCDNRFLVDVCTGGKYRNPDKDNA